MLPTDFNSRNKRHVNVPEAKPDILSLALYIRQQPKLSLGQIVITTAADSVLNKEDVNAGLRRHSFGDWGSVCAEDWKTNNQRCAEKGMVLSAYESAKGVIFWIISDPGHEVTTVLLPSDY